MGEVKQLIKKPIEGIEYIEGDDNSISEVHCYISGPKDTPFYGGKFRVKLVLQNDYPASPPRGFFLTRIYHPNVATNGDICVNTLKKDWKPEVTLGHIFQVIRCLLIIPFPESSLNDEAGKLFMDNYDDFARRARIMTEVHAIPVTTEELTDTLTTAAAPATVFTKVASSVSTNSSATSAHSKSDSSATIVATESTTGGSAVGADENSSANANNQQVAKSTTAGVGTAAASNMRKKNSTTGTSGGKSAAGGGAKETTKKNTLKRL